MSQRGGGRVRQLTSRPCPRVQELHTLPHPLQALLGGEGLEGALQVAVEVGVDLVAAGHGWGESLRLLGREVQRDQQVQIVCGPGDALKHTGDPTADHELDARRGERTERGDDRVRAHPRSLIGRRDFAPPPASARPRRQGAPFSPGAICAATFGAAPGGAKGCADSRARWTTGVVRFGAARW